MAPLTAMAQNLCSQLGDLGNCCLGKNILRPLCLLVRRELEEDKGILFVQGGGGGEPHLALPGGKVREDIIGFFLICLSLHCLPPGIPGER